MARDTWYRLDNIGKYYSAQAGRRAQTVFRYSATMDAPVDEAALQRALDRTVGRFPTFSVALRTGLFWHYLQHVDAVPKVRQEDLPICAPLHAGHTSVLFRVSWYRDRINFEVSHMVSDGRGSLSFFKELLAAYVEAAYGVTDVPSSYAGSASESAEDSFDKNYEPKKAGAGTLSAAVHVTSPKHPEDPAFFEYHLPCGEVLSLAHKWGVSLTSVVIAAVALAVRRQMHRREVERRPIRIGMPVDLRGAFASQTTRNFFGLAYVTLPTHDEVPEASDLAREVQRQVSEAVLPENIKQRMNSMIRLERNPLVRVAPVFAKDLVLGLARFQEERGVTCAVSNLGRVELPEAVASHVRSANILTSTQDLNFTLCSVGNDLSIGISTVYANRDVIRDFCRFFSARGIHGTVNCSLAKPLAGQKNPGAHGRDGQKRQGRGKGAGAKPLTGARKALPAEKGAGA
ncbi:hypothetical protein AAK967_05760 [Atopobiaceae bacterium 24-176]